MNARAVSPLIERIVKGAAIIRDRESSYRQLVATIPGIVYQSEPDDKLTMREISEAISEITGRPAAAFVDNAELNYLDIVLPEDRQHALDRKAGWRNSLAGRPRLC